jgi:tRNA(Arg) A34 adenosine deaminase TadA
MKRNSKSRIAFVILLVIPGIIILSYVFTFVVVRNVPVTGKVDKQLIDSLISLRKFSADRKEYPVSSILIYGDSIIGAGYNTFLEKNDPAGHAEINALRKAFENISDKDFRKLDHSKLVLISTYEPCLMCQGMCDQFGIKKIYYMQNKQKYLRRRNTGIEFLSKFRIRRLRVPQNW